jgi:hypothetical protein
MKLFEIEIGRRYKCDLQESEYLGIVKGKRDGSIGVALGSKVGATDEADTFGFEDLIWLAPEDVHPM